ncbi:MAG: hypothetical protein KatS3mg031_0905 [Chitinophagales bacterium]|nr:MAG: hypothetical protein KatS3mg031_0905 [Chitinophagales bacterium]
MNNSLFHYLIGCFPLLSIMACSPQPEPIDFGRDVCQHCKMLISDERYGAELVTKKGKVYKFDSVECLLWHLEENPDLQEKTHLLLVVDFHSPGKLVPALDATYLRAKHLPSPMGMFITAFSSPEAALSMLDPSDEESRQLRWEEVAAFIRQSKVPSQQ